MSHRILRALYLTLALAGLCWTWWNNLAFARAHDGVFRLSEFIADCTVNPAARSIAADVTVGGTAALLWMLVEGRRLGMRFLWAYVAAFYLVAFAFAFPLFLFFRQGRLAARPND